jgi:hypothetical protein
VNSEFNQGAIMESKGTAVIDWYSFTFDGYFAGTDPAVMVRVWLQEWM